MKLTAHSCSKVFLAWQQWRRQEDENNAPRSVIEDAGAAFKRRYEYRKTKYQQTPASPEAVPGENMSLLFNMGKCLNDSQYINNIVCVYDASANFFNVNRF